MYRSVESKPLPTCKTHRKAAAETTQCSNIPTFFRGANLQIQRNNPSSSLNNFGGFLGIGGVIAQIEVKRSYNYLYRNFSYSSCVQFSWFSAKVLVPSLAILARQSIRILLWDKRSWKGEMVEYRNQSITCKLCGVNQELTWFLTAVYASCDRNERMELWEEFEAMRSLCEGLWCHLLS
uniref:Uncharacterized protein n=1 Tax=Solanum lycopersicum TaxID=4081 RepID=A0A3Q7FJX8_SOLLC